MILISYSVLISLARVMLFRVGKKADTSIPLRVLISLARVMLFRVQKMLLMLLKLLRS